MDEFKDFNGYTVYKDGRVYDKYGKKKKVYVRQDGYSNIILTYNGRSHVVLLHRLMAMLFVPNPYNLPDVHHIDHNRSNNSISNLGWVSRRGNAIAHAISSGRCKAVEVTRPDGEKVTYHSINEAARRNGLTTTRVTRLIKNGVDDAGNKWMYLQ